MNGCKRILPIILMSVILTGCSQRSNEIMLIENKLSGEQEHMFLSVFRCKADALNLIAIEKILSRLTEENPDIIVNYESVKGIEYWRAFERRAEASVLGDVFMVDRDRVINIADKGRLADLSSLSTTENYQDRIKEQFISGNGSVYFLPTCVPLYGLYTNYSLLEAHDQKVPENWSDFMEVCDYFAVKGITPVIANNYASLRKLIAAKSLYSVYRQSTASVIKEFNREPAKLANTLRSGVKMVEEMIERKWINCTEVLETEQIPNDLKLFVGGNRLFMVTRRWAAIRVKNMEPNFSYGVHAFPILDDGNVLVVEGNICISVSAGSEHLEEVMRLVKCITQPDSIWEYYDGQSSYTPLQDDRMPADRTIPPATECFECGRIVLGSDFRLDLPVDASLAEIAWQILSGVPTDEAITQLKQLLTQ